MESMTCLEVRAPSALARILLGYYLKSILYIHSQEIPKDKWPSASWSDMKLSHVPS